MRDSIVLSWVNSAPPDPIKVIANRTFGMTGQNATQRKIMEESTKYPGKVMEIIWQRP